MNAIKVMYYYYYYYYHYYLKIYTNPLFNESNHQFFIVLLLGE